MTGKRSDPTDGTPMHEPLSQTLCAMVARGGSQTIPISALFEGTQERGFYLLLILLSLPFVSPIPLPGLSTVVGLAVALMSFRLAWRLPPRLPGFLGKREISRAHMEKFVRKTAIVFRAMEKIVKPRLGDWLEWRPVKFTNALLLASMGLLLALPLPPVLPFSNSLPCWGIILIALSMMERDGLLIWAGYVVALATTIYLAFFTGAVFVGIEKLFESLRRAIGT